MPASPISRKLSTNEFPRDWESLNKVIIPDSKTDHYYGVDFNPKTSTASLMCCQLDDNPSLMVDWYHVEEMEEIHRTVLNTIRDVFGVSFHDSIRVEMGSTEVFPARGLTSE